MVTAYREKRIGNNGLLSFLADIGANNTQLKLLYFWVRHPKAKLTVMRALETAKNNLRDAITTLAEKGILIAQHNSSGSTTYSLSDQRNQEYMSELAKLDWSQVLSLGRQLTAEAISPSELTE